MRPIANARLLGTRAPPFGRGASARAEQALAAGATHYDWAVFGFYVQLVLHAARRHTRLFLLLWLGVVVASMGLTSLLPKTYEVQTTLQVQRPAGLSGANDSDTQTKQAVQAVLRRDNLVALLQQTDFLKSWPLHRAPVLRVKDFLWAHLFKAPTEEEKIDGFVGMLEKQLWVTPGEGTVTIGVQLSDPQLALHLVESSLQNFLDARHTAEISSIGEVISILEARTASAHEALEESLKELQKLRTARAVKLGLNVRRVSVPAMATLPDPETEQLLVQVKSKRLAIADLDDFHRRHVEELENRLAQLRTTYSDTHPAVADAQEALDAARPESTQVVALRQELAPLEAELKQRGFDANAALSASTTRELALQRTLQADDPQEDQDPGIDFAKSQARHALTHYNDLLDRTAAARLEQDRAGAAFKYRYVVLWPPQRPLGPFRPKPLEIFLASLLAGLLLSLLGVTFVDVSSQKLLEPWQLERPLGLPLLGTLSTRELIAPVRDKREVARPPEEILVPSAAVNALWRSLMVKPWTTLAVVSPEDGARAWRLAQLLVAAAGKPQRPVLKAVNFVDLTLLRAASVAQALAVGNFTGTGERMRFVVATASPLQNPAALSVLAVCDASVLVLELGTSLLPDAEATLGLLSAEQPLGAVLTTKG
ncbi:MAG: hypothetical protein ACLQDQ_17245 [Myxococcaceae bacterium]